MLGDPLVVNRYLEFVRGRCRPNTLRATVFDLKTFFTVVSKPPAEVHPVDVFDFLVHQRGDRKVDQRRRHAVQALGQRGDRSHRR